MAHKKHYFGGLTFNGNPGGALSRCSCIVADTLEEYGHSIEQFSARASDVIALACDHYRIVLRHSSLLSTGDDQRYCSLAQARRTGVQHVEITIIPNFPDHCDDELSELLMAVILYRLVHELGAKQIEWMDAVATMSREQFLGVFANVQTQPDVSSPPRGADRFASVEQTAEELDHYCDAMTDNSRGTIRPKPSALGRSTSPYRLAAWARARIADAIPASAA